MIVILHFLVGGTFQKPIFDCEDGKYTRKQLEHKFRNYCQCGYVNKDGCNLKIRRQTLSLLHKYISGKKHLKTIKSRDKTRLNEPLTIPFRDNLF